MSPRGIGLLVLCLGAMSPASAESLKDAVSFALQEHPAIQATRATVDEAGRDIDLERSSFRPTLEGEIGAGLEDSGTGANETQGPAYEAELSVNWNLYNGGSDTNAVAAAERAESRAGFDLTGSREAIALRAAIAYVNVLRSRFVVEQAAANVRDHESIFERVSLKAKATGESADRLQSQSRLLRAQDRARRFQTELANAETDFLEAVGRMPAADLDPADALDSPLLASVEDAIDAALQANAGILSAGEEVEVRRLEEKVEYGDFLPDLDLEGSHQWQRHDDGANRNSTDTSLMLTLSYDFYAGGSRKARHERAQVRTIEARHRLQERKRLVMEQVRVDFANYVSARDRLSILEGRVSTAAEVVQVYRQQFDLGRRSLLDVLDVEDELFAAQVDQAAADADLRINEYRVVGSASRLIPSLGLQ